MRRILSGFTMEPKGQANGVGFSRQLQRSLPCDTRAPSLARRSLALLEPTLSSDAFYTMLLLVTELVTNSVRHSGTTAPETIALTVSTQGETLRASVTDAGSEEIAPPTQPREIGLTATCGRGLLLVDKLSERWGVMEGQGNTVWFELRAS